MSMLDKKLFTEELRKFKDTEKFSVRQLARFLYENEITKNFYLQKVNEIKQYFKIYPELKEKYAEDKYYFKNTPHCHYECSYQYTEKEREIIHEIIQNHLITFWCLDAELNNKIDILHIDETTQKLLIDVYISYDTEIEEFIDYIEMFGVIPYSESNIPNIDLTETERIILKYLHEGLSVPQIADKMNSSKYTIENHKKNVCNKIDELELDEYHGKKALAKLLLLAQKIFR